MSALPSASSRPGGQGRPGGTRRFLIAMLIAILLLGGVVYGMIYWLESTSSSHEGYGPDKLAFPENRYYRQNSR